MTVSTASTVQAASGNDEERAAERRRRGGWLPRRLGAFAGVLAITLVAYSVVGAVWGFLRPSYDVTVGENGTGLLSGTSDSVQFASFMWFTVLTGAVACVISLLVFFRSRSTRGVFMLLWVGVCVSIGSFVLLTMGDMVANLVHPMPETDTLPEGATFTVVPGMWPGVAFFVAPFLAVALYWSATFVTPDIDEEFPGSPRQ